MSAIKKVFEWLFYLIDNMLTHDENDKIAKVRSRKTKTLDDIAERIVKERTEYRKETILNILAMANSVKLDFIAQGEMINDGLVIFEPAVTGNFNGITEFDETLHSCVVNVHAGNDIHRMLKQVKGVYSGLTVENGGAEITGISDTATGLTNGVVTPGKTVTVTGKKIRVVPQEGETAASCITFAKIGTQEIITQQDAPVINDPSKIVIQLPSLPAGEYLLTLKTLYSTNAVNLKAPRYITSKIKLVVK
jgi:hypothetical protein